MNKTEDSADFQAFLDSHERRERLKKTHAPEIALYIGHPELGVVKPVRIGRGGQRVAQIQVGFNEEVSLPRYMHIYERVPSTFEGRFMPSLLDKERKKRWHIVVYHKFFQTVLVCPKHTDPALLPGEGEDRTCPCCMAGFGPSHYDYIVFGALFSKKHNPLSMVFQVSGVYGDSLNELLRDGCFDLDGHTYKISVGSGLLLWERCRKSVITQESLRTAYLDEIDLKVKPGSLQEIAKVQKVWEDIGEPRPEKGRADYLMEKYPAATFVPVNYGTKKATVASWQNTGYGDYRAGDQRWRLDAGNIGIVFGPIGLYGRAASAAQGVELADGALVACLDPDDDVIHRELRAANPWLKKTWAVKGARGAKYIFIVNGTRKANPKAWETTRLIRRLVAVCEDKAKYEDVGELLSTNHKGTVSGLHPDGIFYETAQDEPMYVLNDASEFKLPQGVILGTLDLRDKRCPHPFPSRKYEPPKLDIGVLYRVRKGVKGMEAQCPACAAENKDHDCDNLLIYPDGRFMCARFIGLDEDCWREHRHAILEEAWTGERGSYDDSEADHATGHFDANYQRELFY